MTIVDAIHAIVFFVGIIGVYGFMVVPDIHRVNPDGDGEEILDELWKKRPKPTKKKTKKKVIPEPPSLSKEEQWICRSVEESIMDNPGGWIRYVPETLTLPSWQTPYYVEIQNKNTKVIVRWYPNTNDIHVNDMKLNSKRIQNLCDDLIKQRKYDEVLKDLGEI
jgi:hypothetical protein